MLTIGHALLKGTGHSVHDAALCLRVTLRERMAFVVNTSAPHLAHLALLVAFSTALAILLMFFLGFGTLSAFGVAVTAVCQANSKIAAMQAGAEVELRKLELAEEKAERAAKKKSLKGVGAKKLR